LFAFLDDEAWYVDSQTWMHLWHKCEWFKIFEEILFLKRVKTHYGGPKLLSHCIIFHGYHV
jgi:hypothetical protein